MRLASPSVVPLGRFFFVQTVRMLSRIKTFRTDEETNWYYHLARKERAKLSWVNRSMPNSSSVRRMFEISKWDIVFNSYLNKKFDSNHIEPDRLLAYRLRI